MSIKCSNTFFLYFQGFPVFLDNYFESAFTGLITIFCAATPVFLVTMSSICARFASLNSEAPTITSA